MKTLTGLGVAAMVLLLVASSGAARPLRPDAGPVPLSQPERPVVVSAPLGPADLALQLESLLGEHSVLAADMMRSRISGDQDFAQTANAALGQNTDEMADLIASN